MPKNFRIAIDFIQNTDKSEEECGLSIAKILENEDKTIKVREVLIKEIEIQQTA